MALEGAGSTPWRTPSKHLDSLTFSKEYSYDYRDDESSFLPAPATQPSRQPHSSPASVLGSGGLKWKAWRKLVQLWRGATDQAGHDQETLSQTEAHRLDTVSSYDTDGGLADEVDEIVVDRLWRPLDEKEGVRASAYDADPASVASDRRRAEDDERQMRARDSWPRWPWWLFRWKIFPRLQNFYQPLFDPVTEAAFREEQWKTGRPLAGISAIFYITNWVSAGGV
jgi:hypothetical protein